MVSSASPFGYFRQSSDVPGTFDGLTATMWVWAVCIAVRRQVPDAGAADLRGEPVARAAGHGERSRLQLLFKLAGTDTEGFPFWLFNLVVPVCLRVFLVFCRVIKGVLVPETRSPCFSRWRSATRRKKAERSRACCRWTRTGSVTEGQACRGCWRFFYFVVMEFGYL